MGCINAGLMRLDPLGSKAERRKQVDDLVRKAFLLLIFVALARSPCFLAARRGLLLLAATLTPTEWTPVAKAISGGGKDYASSTLTSSFKGLVHWWWTWIENWSGKYDKKDFSGCIANSLDFTESTFRGCRFYKADLGGSDFSKSDLTGASLEGANLEDVNFENANLEGAYFTSTILQAKNLKGAILTEALMPADVLQKLCERKPVKPQKSPSRAPEPLRVSELTENDQTYLPEQYFLVKELPGWHHIEVAWNCEVNAEWYVQPEPRKNRRNKDKPDKPRVQLSEMPDDWWQLSNEGNVEQLRRTVGMFHFSGIWLHPWWYIHLQPDQAFTLIQKQFAYRDRRGMVALAVSDWLSALEDLRECKEIQGEQATYLLNIIDDLAWCSSCWWEVAEPCGENCTWYKDETICEECLVKAKFTCHTQKFR
eukprot:symbB.v1.2.023524.t1/scaffold2155.1/size87741/5